MYNVVGVKLMYGWLEEHCLVVRMCNYQQYVVLLLLFGSCFHFLVEIEDADGDEVEDDQAVLGNIVQRRQLVESIKDFVHVLNKVIMHLRIIYSVRRLGRMEKKIKIYKEELFKSPEEKELFEKNQQEKEALPTDL